LISAIISARTYLLRPTILILDYMRNDLVILLCIGIALIGVCSIALGHSIGNVIIMSIFLGCIGLFIGCALSLTSNQEV
jgi:hypothetical protein